MKYKNYEYLVLQMPMGHLCGYVKLPESHPYYGKDYDNMNIDCHGGLTHATMHDGKEPDVRIHKEYDLSKYFGVGFWIGFDYAHLGDKSFYSSSVYEAKGRLWQPFEVEKECRKVIDQLATKQEE